jgi:hypothetical protein
MRQGLRFLTVVGKAALIVTVGWFALAVTLILIGFKPELIPAKGEILVAMALFLPLGAAVWWLFRKLRAHYKRSEARSVAIAFAVFAPVSLLIGLLLGQIFGGYAEMLLENRLLAFGGALVGVTVVITVMSLAPCALALWITRRIERVDKRE